jgi:hypothetical protein
VLSHAVCSIQAYGRRSILASDSNKDIFNSVRTEPPTALFARLMQVQNMSIPPAVGLIVRCRWHRNIAQPELAI